MSLRRGFSASSRYAATIMSVASITYLGATIALLTPPHPDAHALDGGVGPSTITAPMVLPEAAGVTIRSLLTVGDGRGATNGYRMVGAPDGLGVVRAPGGRARVVMNHELGREMGIPRGHGWRGAFVSDLEIDPISGEVVAGRDLITSVSYWDYASGTYGTVPGVVPGTTNEFGFTLKRFCSGTIAGARELFNPATGRGFNGQMWLTGEELGNNGRLFGVDLATGEARQLPRAGLRSWENALPIPTGTDTTALITTDDFIPGHLGLYVGTKTVSGGPFSRAGLTNGAAYVLTAGSSAAGPLTSEFLLRRDVATYVPTRITWTPVDWNQRGVEQSLDAEAAGATAFVRIEDVAIDPSAPFDIYFVTTERPLQADMHRGRDVYGGLWRLRLDDPANPLLGGTITLLIDGSGPRRPHKPDNLAIDASGHLLIAEDPGDDPRIAGLWAYRLADGALARVAGTDPARFSTRATQNEEISGIVDATHVFGSGTFLLDVMVHHQLGLPPGTGRGTVGEYVENGQLLVMQIDWNAVFAPATHQFVPVPPARILDTRTRGATAAPGATTTVQIAGAAGVPLDGSAAAVVLNVTLTEAAAPGYVTVSPHGQPRPATSSLNADATAETVANQVTVSLGETGAIDLFTEQGGHLIVDIAGFYRPVTAAGAGRMMLIEPSRVLDTRQPRPVEAAVLKPPADSTTPVTIAGVAGVPPTGVSAVIINVTATEATDPGFVSVFPTGSARPDVSNLNLNRPGETRAGLVTVPLGGDGTISVYSERGTHLIVDVLGWYTDSSAPTASSGLFVPRPLTRVLDTRVRSRLLPGAGVVVDPGLPASAAAAVVNLTATNAAGGGFLTLWAAGTPQPATSTLNPPAKHATLANAALSQVGVGRLSLSTSVATDAIVDVAGWITD